MSTTEWIIVSGLLFWLSTCLAILDIARKDFGSIQKKAIWGFVALVPFIGVLAYFSVGFRQGRPKRADATTPVLPKC